MACWRSAHNWPSVQYPLAPSHRYLEEASQIIRHGGLLAMKSQRIRIFLVLFFYCFATGSWAQQTAHVEPAKSASAKPPVKASAGRQTLYGSLPLYTKSA